MNTTRSPFLLVGGRLCLDFINTEPWSGDARSELLGSYHDLVEWARHAGALDGAEADHVLEKWGTGLEADGALEAARALRRQLRLVAEQLTGGNRQVGPEAVEAINLSLRGRPGYLQLERDGVDWAARWKVPLRRPEDVLWRVARSAASLLADDDLALVKRCARQACRLFFYDDTKNHSKRYCRMDVCGAAERAAAYYARKAKAPRPAGPQAPMP